MKRFSASERTAVIFMVLASLLLVIFELVSPTSFITETPLREITDMAITRLLGGVVFFFLMRYMEFSPNKPGILPSSEKGFLLTLPFLAVAVNNAPWYSLAKGTAVLDAPLWQFGLVAIECLAIAWFEETAFRGVFMELWIRSAVKKGKRNPLLRALVGSSAIFGGVHLMNLLAGSSPLPVLQQIGYSFLIGGMCGMAYLLTGRLFLAVLLHAVYDFCGQLVPYLGQGELWEIPTVILTALLGTAVAVYAVFLLFRLFLRNPLHEPRQNPDIP